MRAYRASLYISNDQMPECLGPCACKTILVYNRRMLPSDNAWFLAVRPPAIDVAT